MILDGSAETRETHYLVKYLDEDELYHFKVYALSLNDYEIASKEYELNIPPYRRIKAIAIGTIVGLLFIFAGIAVFLYMKRKMFFKARENSGEKIQT